MYTKIIKRPLKRIFQLYNSKSVNTEYTVNFEPTLLLPTKHVYLPIMMKIFVCYKKNLMNLNH